PLCRAGAPTLCTLALHDALPSFAGAESFTVIINVALFDPPELLAVTVKVVVAVTAVGVPVIVPVVASKLRPAGNAGLIVKPVGDHPEGTGLIARHGQPSVSVVGL